MKSLKYQLPALILSFDDCNKIMKNVKQGLLNSSHISISIPFSALYGPKDEGGLQLNHLYLTQGLMHLKKNYRFFSTNTNIGKLLRTSVEACVLEIGIGRNLFTLDYERYHCLASDFWIETLWHFAYKHGITITDRITKFPLPK